MKKYLISLMVLSVLFGCKKSDQVNTTPLPEIVIETNKDTLRIGEEYIAKVFLSDGSLLYLKEVDGRKKSILPIFRINVEIVETDEKYFLFREVVANGDSLNPKYSFKEWDCAIIFPHPKVGAVELSVRFSYVIDKSPLSID